MDKGNKKPGRNANPARAKTNTNDQQGRLVKCPEWLPGVLRLVGEVEDRRALRWMVPTTTRRHLEVMVNVRGNVALVERDWPWPGDAVEIDPGQLLEVIKLMLKAGEAAGKFRLEQSRAALRASGGQS